MASLTRWTWVWVGSGSWWWTGKSGMLQSMRSQRVGHDWVTDLNWTEFTLIHRPTSPGSYAIFLFIASTFTFTNWHINNWVFFLLWLSLFILPWAILSLFTSSLLDTYWPGASSCSVISFAFSYSSWGFQGKDDEVVSRSFLQWSTFCQNSPLWPICLVWPYMAWLIVSLS